MSLTPDRLAARYDRPYRRANRIEIPAGRFEKGLERGDDGAWGVGALVRNDGRALFVREGDTWLLPGGRLEPGESPEAGARREVREETGVEITIVGLGAIAEQTFVREGTDEKYEFYFATFLGEPSDPAPGPIGSDESTIDEIEWRSDVPSNTFDRALVARLAERHL